MVDHLWLEGIALYKRKDQPALCWVKENSKTEIVAEIVTQVSAIFSDRASLLLQNVLLGLNNIKEFVRVKTYQ